MNYKQWAISDKQENWAMSNELLPIKIEQWAINHEQWPKNND